MGAWPGLALALVSFAAGLGLAPADLARLGERGGAVLGAVAVQLLAGPALALALGMALDLPPAVVAGLVLVGAAPGTVAGHLLTTLAGGDLPLARSITAVGTVLAVALLPATARWLLPGHAGFDAAMVLLVLLPAGLGLLVARVAPALARRMAGPAATLGSLLTAGLMLAAVLAGAGPAGGWAAAAWGAIALALALAALGRLAARSLRLAEGGAIALGLAAPMRNVAIPLALALGAGRPDWAAPAAVYGLAMYALALALMAARLRRR